jgi:short chain dehydrogenase
MCPPLGRIELRVSRECAIDFKGGPLRAAATVRPCATLSEPIASTAAFDVYEYRFRRMNMSRIFVTGSADGLGKMAAQLLIDQGHEVVLHARNKMRAQEALAAVPGAETVAVGDVASIAQTRDVAEQINRLGRFDAVIHNVGIGYREPRRIQTEDGLPHVFAINTLAPYLLTALIDRPKRLVYLSSGLHRSGDISLEDLAWEPSTLEWHGSGFCPRSNDWNLFAFQNRNSTISARNDNDLGMNQNALLRHSASLRVNPTRRQTLE